MSDTKLKSLFGELKLLDKEEIVWKKLRSEGKDKDGVKEAELRKKFLVTARLYGLSEEYDHLGQNMQSGTFNEATSPTDGGKKLFRDKKLNKLWAKVETAGFSAIELDALKEEFGHHQDKIDQYYEILSDVKDREQAETEDKYKSEYYFLCMIMLDVEK